MTHYNTDEVLGELRQRILTGTTQEELAHQLDISPQYLSDVLNKRREPGKKLLDAIGYERVVCYQQRYTS